MQIETAKKYLPIIVAGVLGLIGIVLVNYYIQQQSAQAQQSAVQSQKNLSRVVVATQDIPSGTNLKESMLEEQTVNKRMLQPRVATSIDRLIDKVTVAPISKGEQVLLNKVTGSSQEVSLSNKIPVGKRAISIPVDNISSVGGMTRPGDHVDVVGMVPMGGVNAEGKQVTSMTTMPLFQNVLVLAVGQEYGNAGGAKKEERISPVVTFALSPQEANLIAFVQEQGKIRLILRSPGDAQIQPVAPASWDSLLRTVMPQAFQQEQASQEPPKPRKKVEIYHGLQKEVKNLE